MSHRRLASLTSVLFVVGFPVAMALGLAAPGCGASPVHPVHLDAGTSCAAGLGLCSGTCTNLQSSSAHCGACNKACVAGQTCKSGVCAAATGCSIGKMDCGGTCVDLTSDATNCGACGMTCAMGESCTSSMCVAAGTCPPGQMMCTTGCADLTNDSANCGGCDTICMAGQTCQAGVCTKVNGGGGVATGTCKDLVTCLNACMPGDMTCQNTCAAAASQSAISAYNALVTCIQSACPNSNNGVCDSAAGNYSQTACQNCIRGAQGGRCTAQNTACFAGGGGGCPGGQTMCAGACTDLTSDPSNCGACGQTCGGGQTCVAGACSGGGGGGVATCNDSLACLNLNSCAPADAACIATCEAQTTPAAAKLLDALISCLNSACPANNGGACVNPNSRSCLRCLQNAQNGGKCTNQINACQNG